MNEILQTVWSASENTVAVRVLLIEEAIGDLIEGRLDDERRERARRAAHALAGAVGMFGFLRAGQAAHSLEAQLHRGGTPGPERRRLLREELVVLAELRA